MDIPQSLAAGVTDELTRFPTIGLGSSTGVLWQVSKWWEGAHDKSWWDWLISSSDNETLVYH